MKCAHLVPEHEESKRRGVTDVAGDEARATNSDEDMTPKFMTMFGAWLGWVGGQQGCPSQEGGPRLIRFESPRWRLKATQVRVCLGLQDQSAISW